MRHLGGSILFSYSKTPLVLSLTLLFAACGKDAIQGSERTTIEPYQVSKYDLSPIQYDNGVFESHFAESKVQTACERVKELSAIQTTGSKFRLLSKFGLSGKLPTSIFSNMNAEPQRSFSGDGKIVDDKKLIDLSSVLQLFIPCSDDAKGGTRLICDKTDKYSNISLGLQGRVDMSQSPLYEYSLVSQMELPNEEQILKMVDDEIFKSPIKFPFILTFRLGLMTGVVNPFTVRNNKVVDTVNDAFPGAFESSELLTGKREVFPLHKSFPEALINNGVPAFATLLPTPQDSREDLIRKEKAFRAVLEAFTAQLPLFVGQSWSDWRFDMRRSLSVAIRWIQTSQADEQACASVLMHRSMAQMLSVMGYDKVPTVAINGGHALPKLETLLGQKSGLKVKVCPRGGSFVLKDKLLKLSEADLSSYSPDKKYFNLTKTPSDAGLCTTAESVLVDSPQYKSWVGQKVDQFAGFSELMEFTSALHYFVAGFNPGSPWWFSDLGTTPLPLSQFKDLKSIPSEGGLLPFKAYALSLGLMQIGAQNLQHEHLLYLDRDGKEAKIDNAIGIRLSVEPLSAVRKSGTHKVLSKLRSVALLAEMAVKLSRTLEMLDMWRDESARRLDQEIVQEPNQDNQEKIRREYDDFINGLFGNASNLDLLVNNGPGSLRAQLAKLRLASAMLLSSFVKENPDGSITCFDSIETNYANGVEKKIGTCSSDMLGYAPSDKRIFIEAIQLLAYDFQSPIFKSYLKRLGHTQSKPGAKLVSAPGEQSQKALTRLRQIAR